MNKTEFMKFAEESNSSLSEKNESVLARREIKIKSASAKLLEIVSFIKDNSPLKMNFYVCLDKKFAMYDRNWVDIYLPEQNIYIFLVENQFDNDIVFQLWKRKNILIFNKDSDIDFIGSELARKMEYAANLENSCKEYTSNLEREYDFMTKKIEKVRNIINKKNNGR